MGWVAEWVGWESGWVWGMGVYQGGWVGRGLKGFAFFAPFANKLFERRLHFLHIRLGYKVAFAPEKKSPRVIYVGGGIYQKQNLFLSNAQVCQMGGRTWGGSIERTHMWGGIKTSHL